MRQRPRIVAVIAGIVASGALLTGCASPSDSDIANTLTQAAESDGYRCVETVPPSEAVVELRTCTTDDERVLYVVKLASDAPLRDQGVVGVGSPEEFVRQSGAWAVVGAAKTDVESVAAKLS